MVPRRVHPDRNHGCHSHNTAPTQTALARYRSLPAKLPQFVPVCYLKLAVSEPRRHFKFEDDEGPGNANALKFSLSAAPPGARNENGGGGANRPRPEVSRKGEGSAQLSSQDGAFLKLELSLDETSSGAGGNGDFRLHRATKHKITRRESTAGPKAAGVKL